MVVEIEQFEDRIDDPLVNLEILPKAFLRAELAFAQRCANLLIQGHPNPLIEPLNV
jgi:hypothetical protein